MLDGLLVSSTYSAYPPDRRVPHLENLLQQFCDRTFTTANWAACENLIYSPRIDWTTDANPALRHTACCRCSKPLEPCGRLQTSRCLTRPSLFRTFDALPRCCLSAGSCRGGIRRYQQLHAAQILGWLGYLHRGPERTKAYSLDHRTRLMLRVGCNALDLPGPMRKSSAP